MCQALNKAEIKKKRTPGLLRSAKSLGKGRINYKTIVICDAGRGKEALLGSSHHFQAEWAPNLKQPPHTGPEATPAHRPPPLGWGRWMATIGDRAALESAFYTVKGHLI